VVEALCANGQHFRRTDNTWPFPLPLNIGTVSAESTGRERLENEKGTGMSKRVIG
jgi:hypothetical protein